MIVLWDYYGIPEGILWDSYGISLLFLCYFHVVSMIFLWVSVEFLWDLH